MYVGVRADARVCARARAASLTLRALSQCILLTFTSTRTDASHTCARSTNHDRRSNVAHSNERRSTRPHSQITRHHTICGSAPGAPSIRTGTHDHGATPAQSTDHSMETMLRVLAIIASRIRIDTSALAPLVPPGRWPTAGGRAERGGARGGDGRGARHRRARSNSSAALASARASAGARAGASVAQA